MGRRGGAPRRAGGLFSSTPGEGSWQKSRVPAPTPAAALPPLPAGPCPSPRWRRGLRPAPRWRRDGPAPWRPSGAAAAAAAGVAGVLAAGGGRGRARSHAGLRDEGCGKCQPRSEGTPGGGGGVPPAGPGRGGAGGMSAWPRHRTEREGAGGDRVAPGALPVPGRRHTAPGHPRASIRGRNRGRSAAAGAGACATAPPQGCHGPVPPGEASASPSLPVRAAGRSLEGAGEEMKRLGGGDGFAKLQHEGPP